MPSRASHCRGACLLRMRMYWGRQLHQRTAPANIAQSDGRSCETYPFPKGLEAACTHTAPALAHSARAAFSSRASRLSMHKERFVFLLNQGFLFGPTAWIREALRSKFQLREVVGQFGFPQVSREILPLSS